MSQADGVAGQSDLVRVLAAAAEQVAGAQVDSEADTVTSIVSAAAETVPGGGARWGDAVARGWRDRVAVGQR